jgi:hypothetical protein
MDLASYSPAVRNVLTEDRLLELGPGRANETKRKQLAALTTQDLFLPNTVRRADCADACLAAVWLYHDFLDESHSISQSIDTAEGSYWHGIMHRREPDASNAAYWFRHLGDHPVFEGLAQVARDLGLELQGNGWNPFTFIDLCEKYRGTASPQEMLLRRVQLSEFSLLFDWCYRRAIGG